MWLQMSINLRQMTILHREGVNFSLVILFIYLSLDNATVIMIIKNSIVIDNNSTSTNLKLYATILYLYEYN